MPFLVKHLIEGKPDPVIAPQDWEVARALSLMIEHDFSQLPVVDDDNHPLGMVTYESILRGMRNFKVTLNDLHVRDVLVSASTFNLEDDLFDMLALLKLTNAVLIEDPGGYLCGIVTSYDSTEYFQNRAENLMRVDDIESTLKEVILTAFSKEDGTIDDARLAQAVSKVDYQDGSKNKSKTFDQLSLGQYILLIISKQAWPKYEPIFQISRDAVRSILEGIRMTRNDLAHFRSEITPEQIDQLRFCAAWLGRCQSDYEERVEKELSKKILVVPGKNTLDPDEFAEEPIPSDSRYAPLGIYLQGQPGNIDHLLLTFSEIEEIIGGSLPPSAYNHRNWWDNTPEIHTQSSNWLEAGWRVGSRNISAKSITFVRIKEREKAYIDFFSSLLYQLREAGKIPVRDVSPDGASWVVIAQEAQITFFGFSFARGKRFRVELYIDTGEQGTTKRLYDHLYAQKETVESVTGPLSWERLDNKRASRIALYHQGQITDPEKKLESLKKWGVESMAKFFKVLATPLREATSEIL